MDTIKKRLCRLAYWFDFLREGDFVGEKKCMGPTIAFCFTKRMATFLEKEILLMPGHPFLKHQYIVFPKAAFRLDYASKTTKVNFGFKNCGYQVKPKYSYHPYIILFELSPDRDRLISIRNTIFILTEIGNRFVDSEVGRDGEIPIPESQQLCLQIDPASRFQCDIGVHMHQFLSEHPGAYSPLSRENMMCTWKHTCTDTEITNEPFVAEILKDTTGTIAIEVPGERILEASPNSKEEVMNKASGYTLMSSRGSTDLWQFFSLFTGIITMYKEYKKVFPIQT